VTLLIALDQYHPKEHCHEMTYHILRFYELCGTRSVSQVHDQDFLIQSLSGLISDASRGSKRTSALHLENSQPISEICALG